MLPAVDERFMNLTLRTAYTGVVARAAAAAAKRDQEDKVHSQQKDHHTTAVSARIPKEQLEIAIESEIIEVLTNKKK